MIFFRSARPPSLPWPPTAPLLHTPAPPTPPSTNWKMLGREVGEEVGVAGAWGRVGPPVIKAAAKEEGGHTHARGRAHVHPSSKQQPRKRGAPGGTSSDDHNEIHMHTHTRTRHQSSSQGRGGLQAAPRQTTTTREYTCT